MRWRSLELTSPDYREALAREVERVLAMLDPAQAAGGIAAARPAARRSEGLLRALSTRLADEQPVTARGMLLARELLRDPASPLYSERRRSTSFRRASKRVLGALEP